MEHDSESIVSDMLRQFGHSDSSTEPLEAGSQTHFQVCRGSESFLLKIVNEEYSSSRVRAQIEFVDYLRDCGLPVVETIRATDHEPFAISDDQKSIGILTRWIDGQLVSELPLQEFAGRSGALLARFHEASASFEPSAEFKPHSWFEMYSSGETEWLQEFMRTSEVDELSGEIILSAAEKLQSFFNNDSRDAQNYGILHADFHENNLIYDGERIWIIDLEDIGWGHFPFDLTWPEALYAKHHGSQQAFWKPFLQGYQTISPLELNESEWPLYRLAAAIGLLDMIHTSPVDNAGEIAREWRDFTVGWMERELKVLNSTTGDSPPAE